MEFQGILIEPSQEPKLDIDPCLLTTTLQEPKLRRGFDAVMQGLIEHPPDSPASLSNHLMVRLGHAACFPHKSIVCLFDYKSIDMDFTIVLEEGEYQGSVMSLAGNVPAAAAILGLFLGGLMYPHFGDWLFVLSAVLVLAVVVLSAWFPRGKTETT